MAGLLAAEDENIPMIKGESSPRPTSHGMRQLFEVLCVAVGLWVTRSDEEN